jgi:L-iditol 2-dehydrogenase
MPLVALIPEPNAPVELREVPAPELEENSALFNVEFSEVCGTDVYLQRGLLTGVPYPLVPGHVSVGRLSKIRGTLVDIEGREFREGDRVTFLDVHRTCHQCWYCLVAKATTRCPKRKVYGITYGLDDGLCGGWAEQIYLKPGTLCLRLDADAETFMAGGCALPTALHAIERADIAIGDTVLVLGSGPVGISGIILALMRGALKVFCIGAPAHRLEAASEAGADAVLNFEDHNLGERLEWVRERTGGRGADVTIEATGAPDAVVEAMRFTRDAGRGSGRGSIYRSWRDVIQSSSRPQPEASRRTRMLGFGLFAFPSRGPDRFRPFEIKGVGIPQIEAGSIFIGQSKRGADGCCTRAGAKSADRSRAKVNPLPRSGCCTPSLRLLRSGYFGDTKKLGR